LKLFVALSKASYIDRRDCGYEAEGLAFIVFTEATNVNHDDGISRHRLTPYDVHTLHYKL